MGTPAFAAVSLRALLDGPHHVAAVVTRPDKPRGRGKKLAHSAVKEVALEHGLKLCQPRRGSDPALAGLLTELRPDLAVVVAFGNLLPADVIDAPRLGTINVHASLLPLLRGAAPIQRAILDGHTTTGVTIMRINEEMDAGDTMLRRSVPIAPDATTGSLGEDLATVGADLLAEALDLLARGRAVFTPQDHSKATYAPPIKREESRVDWSRSCEELDRQVRAFLPRPGAYALDAERRLKITGARPEPGSEPAEPGTVIAVGGDTVTVACGAGALAVEWVQPEGRKQMSAGDYMRGYHRDGERIRLS